MSKLKKRATNIIEEARRELGVTRDQYAFCAYVHYRCADPRQRVLGWCNDSKDEVADFVGISRPGLYKMAKAMSDFGLVEINENGAYRVTEKWIDTEAGCKQSLQNNSGEGVNKVYNGRKQSLQKIREERKLSLQTPISKINNSKIQLDLAENKFPQPDQQDTTAAQKKEKPLPGAAIRVTIIEGHEEIIEPPAKPPRATKQKPQSDGVIQAMVTAFEAEHKQHFKDAGGEWIGFTWQSKEFPALKAIQKELEKRYREKMRADPTPENIVESWSLFLRKAAKCDRFILDNLFTPSKIWGQFQSIVQKIHTNNGRPPSATSTGGKLDQNERNRLAAEKMVRDVQEGRF